MALYLMLRQAQHDERVTVTLSLSSVNYLPLFLTLTSLCLRAPLPSKPT